MERNIYMSFVRLAYEYVLWRLLGRQKSFVIMQARLFRESEKFTFARHKDSAEKLLDHMQNWIDGVLPLIEESFYSTQLGVYLIEFWPNLQFSIFSILGGAYFDAVRTLRFSLESVLTALSGSLDEEERPSYARIIDSLQFLSTEEGKRVKALYGKLSELAHLSRTHLWRLLEEPGRAFTMFYDGVLFQECCGLADEVTGIIFAIILELYPQIREKARKGRFFYESLKGLPFAGNRI
jgi:hypothetical protein